MKFFNNGSLLSFSDRIGFFIGQGVPRSGSFQMTPPSCCLSKLRQIGQFLFERPQLFAFDVKRRHPEDI